MFLPFDCEFMEKRAQRVGRRATGLEVGRCGLAATFGGEEMASQPDLIVYTPVERGEGESHFVRVGAAWRNRKEGFNVRLDASPVNGNLVLLPPREREDNKG